MELVTECYRLQEARWPKRGRAILAQFDSDSVTVYQAYRPSIGRSAAANGHFVGSGFRFSRMTWIKPGFLWMMYRSGWGLKEGQEVTLSIRLAREAFDRILGEAVHSVCTRDVYPSTDDWRREVASSNVRLQWDPDHTPTGAPLERRVIQLGLRGSVARRYAREWILGIDDISAFVEGQRRLVAAGRLDQLVTPLETAYPISDAAVADRLGLSLL